MQGFEDVTLGWKGEEFTVPANKQMMLIARIEDVLLGGQGGSCITILMQPGGPGQARLAQAYAAALRYAGASVTDADVYLSIQNDMANGEAAAAVKVQQAIFGLLAIISPPVWKKLSSAMGEDGEPEKTEPADGSEPSTA